MTTQYYKRTTSHTYKLNAIYPTSRRNIKESVFKFPSAWEKSTAEDFLKQKYWYIKADNEFLKWFRSPENTFYRNSLVGVSDYYYCLAKNTDRMYQWYHIRSFGALQTRVTISITINEFLEAVSILEGKVPEDEVPEKTLHEQFFDELGQKVTKVIIFTHNDEKEGPAIQKFLFELGGGWTSSHRQSVKKWDRVAGYTLSRGGKGIFRRVSETKVDKNHFPFYGLAELKEFCRKHNIQSKTLNLTNNGKQKSINIQTETTTIRTGKRKTGSRIHSGRSKNAIRVGHLSNQKRSCYA